MGNQQSTESKNGISCTDDSGTGTENEIKPICKIEPIIEPKLEPKSEPTLTVDKIPRKRKRPCVDDDIICISSDDESERSGPTELPAKSVKLNSSDSRIEMIDLTDDIDSDNTNKDDSNTDSDVSPIKHHRSDSGVNDSMEVDDVKKSLFPIDIKYECSVSIYNCNADDIIELQVSLTV